MPKIRGCDRRELTAALYYVFLLDSEFRWALKGICVYPHARTWLTPRESPPMPRVAPGSVVLGVCIAPEYNNARCSLPCNLTGMQYAPSKSGAEVSGPTTWTTCPTSMSGHSRHQWPSWPHRQYSGPGVWSSPCGLGWTVIEPGAWENKIKRRVLRRDKCWPPGHSSWCRVRRGTSAVGLAPASLRGVVPGIGPYGPWRGWRRHWGWRSDNSPPRSLWLWAALPQTSPTPVPQRPPRTKSPALATFWRSPLAAACRQTGSHRRPGPSCRTSTADPRGYTQSDPAPPLLMFL